MKVVAYSFNGVQAIDQNSNFTAEVLAAAPGKKIVVCCEAGGTMRQTVNFPQVSMQCRIFYCSCATNSCQQHPDSNNNNRACFMK
jgi:hypothetical protein